MLPRSACPIVLTWLATVACGAPQEATESTRARSLPSGDPLAFEAGPDATSTRAGETHCLEVGAQMPQMDRPPLWLQSYGGPEISGIASDAAGRVWVTQSGKQTLLLTQSGQLLWARPFGERIALTAEGGAYVAGTFEGSASFGALQLDSHGEHDVYLLKISDEGEVLSAFAVGGPENDALESLQVDAAGDIVVSGAGLGTQKLSANGDVLWQKPYSGRLALDRNGDVLLTGALSEDTDFGGGVLHSHGGADVLLVKLSAAGEHLYSKSFGDEGLQQRGEQIAVDSAGNVLLAGTFDGNIDFGTGPLSLPSDACSADAWCLTFGFITKLDREGRALWSAPLGPLREVGGLVVDARGGAILSAASPGGVRPFRLTWLSAFDGDGRERFHRAEWPDTGIGAGRAVALQGCERLIWGLSARPSLEAEEQSFIAAWGP